MKIVNKKRFAIFITIVIILLSTLVTVIDSKLPQPTEREINTPEVTRIENVDGNMVYYFSNGETRTY